MNVEQQIRYKMDVVKSGIYTEDLRELTKKWIESDKTNLDEWRSRPEIKLLKEFLMKPGSTFVFGKEIFLQSDLDTETVKNLMIFLKLDEKSLKGKTLYYTDQREFLLYPIIQLNEEEYLVPPFKFLIESFYNRINAWLSENKKEKYTKVKNKALEIKTLEVFRRLFGNAQYFTEFYFDKQNRAEQDLLIIYKSNIFIIEIKDLKFRPPMRNPIKAYEKIRSDFKIGIQKAYDQCRRLEVKFDSAQKFKIYDVKNSKELFEINPSKIKNVFSIIVTQHKYGGIQTNLSELLDIDEDSPFHWSVCIDDLEVFLLGLMKIKNNSAANNFTNYLEYRELFFMAGLLVVMRWNYVVFS